MKISARDQVLIAAGLMLAGTAAAVFLLIWPMFQQIGEINSQIEATEQEYLAAQALLTQRMQARDNAAATAAELVLLGNRLPETPDLPALIIALQDVADVSGMQLVRVTPADAEAEGGDGYLAYDVTLDLTGRWADYIDFCRRMQKVTRGVRILNASVTYRELTATADDVEPPVPPETQVEASMDIQVYSYAPIEAPVGGEPPAEAPAE